MRRSLLPIKTSALCLLLSLPLCLATAHAGENSNISAADRARAVRSAKAPPAKVTAKKAPAKFDFEGEFVDYANWKEVRAFLDEMSVKHGFDRAELDTLIGKVRYVESTVQLMKPAPPG